MPTAVESVKLAFVGFIIPFVFIYTPQVLMVGSTGEILITVLAAFIGVLAISVSLQGVFLSRISSILRILIFCVGIILLFPSLISGRLTRVSSMLIPLIVFIIIFIFQKKNKG